MTSFIYVKINDCTATFFFLTLINDILHKRFQAACARSLDSRSMKNICNQDEIERIRNCLYKDHRRSRGSILFQSKRV